VDANRLAITEAAAADEKKRFHDQAQMQKELVRAIEMQLKRALEAAQAEYKVYAEEAIERVTGQVNHLSAHAHSLGGGDASKTEEQEGECDFEGAKSPKSQALDDMEREVTSLRDAMESKQGEVESGMTSVKDGLEDVNCKVCDLEGRVEVIEQSESGLKGSALEELHTLLKRTLYDELYSSMVEELGDHVSRIRSDCEKLGHDIHEAETKIEDFNEKWEEAELPERLDRIQGKFDTLNSKVEAAGKGQTKKEEGARRGACTLDADQLMQLQMPRKSLAALPQAFITSRRSTVHGIDMGRRDSLQSEARSSTMSVASNRSSTCRF